MNSLAATAMYHVVGLVPARRDSTPPYAPTNSLVASLRYHVGWRRSRSEAHQPVTVLGTLVEGAPASWWASSRHAGTRPTGRVLSGCVIAGENGPGSGILRRDGRDECGSLPRPCLPNDPEEDLDATRRRRSDRPQTHRTAGATAKPRRPLPGAVQHRPGRQAPARPGRVPL